VSEWIWSEDDQEWLKKPDSGYRGTGYQVVGPDQLTKRNRLEGLRSVKNMQGGKLYISPPEEPPVSIPMGFHKPCS